MRRFAQYAVMLFLPLLSGHTPGYRTVPTFQQELADLTRRGYTHRYLDNNLIELTEPATGTKRVKSLATTGEATIRAWAQQRGVPIIEIDPALIDTNQYIGWHQYWAEVPLYAELGSLLLADLNRNGKVDIYGIYKDFQSGFESRIYEIDASANVYLAYIYPAVIGGTEALIDADGDSLVEVLSTYSVDYLDYEQPVSGSLPTMFQFQHIRYEALVDPGYNSPFVGYLDNDSLTDILYKGTERDPADSTQALSKVYIAEHDSLIRNLKRVWSHDFFQGQGEPIGGFSVGDFDGDGEKEFVCSDGTAGIVYVCENVSDNYYAVIWQDTIPFVNLYFHGSADIDNNGLNEFFVGATMSNGNWTTIYESDDNNSYTPRAILHILAGGSIDWPNYIASDIDGDGRPEMLIASGAGIFVVKYQGTGYYLWYYKYMPGRLSARVYNFFSEMKQSLVIGRVAVDTFGRGRFYSDIYRPGPALSVREDDPVVKEFSISSNYPNPFNPVTHFEFHVATAGVATLTVYDMLGRELETLVNEKKSPGKYEVTWHADQYPSGVYFYRLTMNSFHKTGKMVLLR